MCNWESVAGDDVPERATYEAELYEITHERKRSS